MSGLKAAEVEYSLLDGYEVRSYWDCEDEFYVAVVQDLPGCAADGATRKEALENVSRLKVEWIETVQRMGHPIPAPKYLPGRVMA